ncbi:MAG TPA: carbohydrate ABC transporter permease [Firmicutes bacterium]|jgi:raffinose/stachyose/melibiose transport system permease protein|nr:carbohydrate ABC transporter permease [Bacillota bacterium]HBL36644.1 carbohydrate ABC transporter permease [Bacillota bacterium]
MIDQTLLAKPDEGQRRRKNASAFFLYAFLIFLALIFICPLILLILTAFKSTREIFMNPFGLPASWSFKTFVRVWQKAHFNIYFFNSILVTLISLALLLFTSTLSAYALARFKFRLNNFLFMLFLAGIMIPIRLGILPLFILMNELGLLDSRWSLILTYAASGMPMSVFILTGFLKTIPLELSEAAKVDGCSEFGILYRIMLPLIRPALATVTIVNFVPWWNDFFFPLLFIKSEKLKTIPLGMSIFFGQYTTDWGMLFAGMVMASLPLLLLYIFMSKQFISGLTSGAVKG